MSESRYHEYNPRAGVPAPEAEQIVPGPRTTAESSTTDGWHAWQELIASPGTLAGEYQDPALERGLRHLRTSPIPPPMPPSERPPEPPVPLEESEAAGEMEMHYAESTPSGEDDDAADGSSSGSGEYGSGDEYEDEGGEDGEEGADEEDEDDEADEESEELPPPVPQPSLAPEHSVFVRRPRTALTTLPGLPARTVPSAAPAAPPGREALDVPPVVPPAETAPGEVVEPPPPLPLPSVPSSAPAAVREMPGPGHKGWPRIQRELSETLMRVGLTSAETDALLQEAASSDVAARALVRLAGMARVTHESSAGQVEDIDNLRQEGAAARETGISANAIRFLHNLPGETALSERLMDAVSRMQVIEQGFQLKDVNGRPRILGVVAAASLWYFREIPRSNRDVKNSPWSTYTGTGVEFLNQILGWNRDLEKTIRIPVDGQPMEIANNDWLCIALETELEGTTQTVHFLTPANVTKDNIEFDTPADSEATRFRMLQGLLDGLAVRRPDGSMLTISDPLASSPLVLSRNFVPRRGKNDTCPADTTELRESLKEQGITLACGSRAIWYIEPSWMAMRGGLFPISPASPEGVPGTPEFRTWLDSARRRNQERFRDRLMPKRELLQLLLSSGAEGIDLNSVARILDRPPGQ